MNLSAGVRLGEDGRRLDGVGASGHGHQLGGAERTRRDLRRPGLHIAEGRLPLPASQHRLRRSVAQGRQAAPELRRHHRAPRTGPTSRAGSRSTSSCAWTAAPARRATRTSSRCARTTSTPRSSGTTARRATRRSASSTRTSATSSASPPSPARRSTCPRRSAAPTGTRRSPTAARRPTRPASATTSSRTTRARRASPRRLRPIPTASSRASAATRSRTSRSTRRSTRRSTACTASSSTCSPSSDTRASAWAANYTVVISGLRYDNNSTAQQYGLPGLSNTANLVAFYEDDHYNARVAYNWRGQFLADTLDGGGYHNPVYTEAYHQIDATLGWNITDHFSLTLDGINLTDGVIRQHERTKEELVSIVQTGRRYMLGARYKF